MTAKQYGPLSILALWDTHKQTLLYLVISLLISIQRCDCTKSVRN